MKLFVRFCDTKMRHHFTGAKYSVGETGIVAGKAGEATT